MEGSNDAASLKQVNVLLIEVCSPARNTALERDGDPLARDFATASERAMMATRTARRSRDYPLLCKRGDRGTFQKGF